MSFFENKRNFIRVDRTGKRRFKHNQYTKKYCTTQPVVNTSEVNMSFVNVNLVLDAYVNITPVNTPPIDIHFDPDPDFSVVVVVDIPNTSSSRNHLEKDVMSCHYGGLCYTDKKEAPNLSNNLPAPTTKKKFKTYEGGNEIMDIGQCY